MVQIIDNDTIVELPANETSEAHIHPQFPIVNKPILLLSDLGEYKSISVSESIYPLFSHGAGRLRLIFHYFSHHLSFHMIDPQY